MYRYKIHHALKIHHESSFIWDRSSQTSGTLVFFSLGNSFYLCFQGNLSTKIFAIERLGSEICVSKSCIRAIVCRLAEFFWPRLLENRLALTHD